MIGLTGVGFATVPQGFIPPQDKDYLVAFAQLPDGATLDRTEKVIREMTSLALAHPGVANSVAFPGLSINGFVNAPNTGIAFVMLKPSHERAHAHGLDANSHRRRSEPALRRDSGCLRRRSSRHRRCRVSGSVGGFKLYIEDRAGLGFEELYQPDAGRGDGRAADTVAGRPVLELPGERAADRRAGRSRAGQDLRHPADRRLRHAAGLPRLALRQRLQPLRTHLPGERAGRVVVPHAAGADRPAEDAQRQRRDGAARIDPEGEPHLRAGPGDALQRLPGRRDQRRTVAGLQLGAGAGRDGGPAGQRPCPTG